MGEKLTIQERIKLVFKFYVYFQKNLHGARLLGHPVQCLTRLDSSRVKKQVWRPMCEPEVFRKQMHCMEESTYDIVETFQRPPQ